MTGHKRFLVIKAALNIISGISMVAIVSLGILYLSFNNAFVFNNAGISVTNNPVTSPQIEFILEGTRKHECTLTRVHADAFSEAGMRYELDFERKVYIRSDDYLGASTGTVDHQWALPVPKDMTAGLYRISLYSEFECIYLMFKASKSQIFDNISLIIE
tara:strand:+ start:3467 stop:3943 length:477 start_codon:yes stop_codon:yes gene_type:complete